MHSYNLERDEFQNISLEIWRISNFVVEMGQTWWIRLQQLWKCGKPKKINKRGQICYVCNKLVIASFQICALYCISLFKCLLWMVQSWYMILFEVRTRMLWTWKLYSQLDIFLEIEDCYLLPMKYSRIFILVALEFLYPS